MRLTFGWEAEGEPDLLARAETESGGAVTVVRAPASAIGGEIGPVIIDGHSVGRIVVVLAEELLGEFAPSGDDSMESLVAKGSALSAIIGDAIARGIIAAEDQAAG